MTHPNFFMIGFPKCGTTAMATYLGSHPQVYFSSLKEPFYWNSDFPIVQGIYGITSLAKYLTLFERAQPRHRVVGEGSTAYIFSSVAVQQIMDFNPAARILVMVRDPVQMVQSWHNEMVFGFQETVTDFEQAWNLQETRAEGRQIPPTPMEARFLQYKQIGAFASFLKPVIEIVPPAQLKVLVLEEFLENPRKIYLELCRFLEIDDDGRVDFPPVRESQTHVWPRLSRFLRHPPAWFRPIAIKLRCLGWQQKAGLVGYAKKLLRRKKQRPKVSPELERRLRETFAPANRQLEDLLGRSLDVWRTSTSEKSTVQ